MNYAIEGQEVFDAISQKLKNLFISSEGNNNAPAFLHSKILLYVVAAILAVRIVTAVLYLPISQNYFFADITKIDLLNLLNENRQSLGLKALTENEKLNQAAMAKAQDMVKNGYFAHQSPSGLTPWFWFKQVGYAYHYAGENLAVGFMDSKTVYDAWFNSPSHKENLLNKNFTEVGTAVLSGFEGNSIVVVQEFGSPLVKAPVAVTTVKPPAPVVVQQPPVQTPEIIETPAPLAPENTVVEENASSTVLPKVLSQSTEYFVGPQYAGKFSLYLQFLNFIVYDNNTILQYLSWSVLLLIVLCMMINIFLGFKMPDKVLVFRAFLLISILIVSMFITGDSINHIISHQVII